MAISHQKAVFMPSLAYLFFSGFWWLKETCWHSNKLLDNRLMSTVMFVHKCNLVTWKVSPMSFLISKSSLSEVLSSKENLLLDVFSLFWRLDRDSWPLTALRFWLKIASVHHRIGQGSFCILCFSLLWKVPFKHTWTQLHITKIKEIYYIF